MRHIIAALAILAMLTSSTAAFAQSTNDTATQFVDFSEFLIEGKVVSPQAQRHRVTDRAAFVDLFELERSFMPELRESVKESALDQ